MVYENENNIQDVEFSEANEKPIRGKILYYSTSQVATLLEIPESTVRYYTKVFDNLLNIELSNKQRRYTDKDIEKMKYIVELKNDGLTIKQIQEYCEEINWDSDSGIQIKENNPLHIQAVAKALTQEQNNQMELFKEELLSVLKANMQSQYSMMERFGNQLKEEIKEEVSITVDDVISDKLEEQKKEIQGMFDMAEVNNRARDLEMIDKLQTKLEDRKKENEGEHKSFWGKLFK